MQYDLTRPNSGRMIDYWLGGIHHFEIDRQLAHQAEKVTVRREAARTGRALARRSVQYFYAHGIRVVFDFGAALPTCENTTSSRMKSILPWTLAKPLAENKQICFQGPEKNGAFDITGGLARQWLKLSNAHGRPNSDVLKPRWNGIDLARRYTDGWIIDFGTGMSEYEAALYATPFAYVVENVRPQRETNKDRNRKTYWWRFGRTGEEMRVGLSGLQRYIATPDVAKHRIFIWLEASIMPDKMLLDTARADDTTFGILHSRFHELWSLRMGTSLEDRPRYTPTTTFETFPFPAGQ